MSDYPAKEVTLKGGRTVTLRCPAEADAQAMLDYVDAVRRETRQVYMCPQEPLLTLEQERAFIRDCDGANALCVLALLDGVIVGMIGVRQEKRYKQRHVASFGMTVRHDVRGRGVGRALLEEVIVFCRSHPDIHKVHLCVYPENDTAIALYGKLGFVEEARLPRHTREADGSFRDELRMSLWVGEGKTSR